MAMSGQVPAADGKIALGAHVAGVTGALILLGVAYTMSWMRYGPIGASRMAWGFVIASYANWAISTGKSFLGVHGVGLTDDAANNAVFVLLSIFVVAPSFAATVAWIRGFGRSTARS
jgi:(hydroxyamino)benzene mutase